MPYPDIYNVTYSYTGFQQAQGDNSFPGTQLDADLAGLESSIDGIAAFVERAIRSDGQLTNGSVTYDSLSVALQVAGLAPADAWVTAHSYLVNNSVVINGGLYRALVAHTSGVFATDLAAGKWIFVAAILTGPQGAQGAQGVPGAWANTRLAKTANYTMLNADRFSTVALGGNALFTLTFNAASGYDAAFAVAVENEDTGRGKKIACNGLASFILWPGQSCIIYNQNNVWKILGLAQVYKLTADTTFYVDKLGFDTNDGLATTTGAFLTMQFAVNAISKYIDANGFLLTVAVGDGTWTENVNLPPVRGIQCVGSHNELILTGNTASLGNTILNPAANNAIHALNNCSTWRIQGFKFTVPGGSAISAEFGANIYLGNNDYGVCSGGHINGAYGSKIELVDNYKISGDSTFHIAINFWSEMLVFGPITVTLSGGTRAFSQFILCYDNSYAAMGGMTFVGAATGQRFYVTNGSGINTNSGGANYFPGNAPGSAQAPSWYDAQVINTADVVGGASAASVALKANIASPSFTGDVAVAGLVQSGGGVRVSAQFDKTSSTVLGDVPGLSVAVAAGQTYGFEVELFTTSNSASGVKAAIAGTATATAVVCQTIITDSTGFAGYGRATALGAASTGATTATVATVRLSGTITVNAGGTLTAQFAQNVSGGVASSVLVGSNMRVWKI